MWQKTIKHPFSMFYLPTKEVSTVLCFVLKDTGSGRAPKKRGGKHETLSSVPHFLAYGVFLCRHRKKIPNQIFEAAKIKECPRTNHTNVLGFEKLDPT